MSEVLYELQYDRHYGEKWAELVVYGPEPVDGDVPECVRSYVIRTAYGWDSVRVAVFSPARISDDNLIGAAVYVLNEYQITYGPDGMFAIHYRDDEDRR